MTTSTISLKKSFLKIEDKKYYYTTVGKGFPTIILLGWSSNLDAFPYHHILKENYHHLSTNKLIFLHLSNFSKSSISSTPFKLENYSEELDQISNILNLKNFNLIGHSAGGRLSLFYTLTYPQKVNKLVLMNSAGLKHKHLIPKNIQKIHIYFSRNLPKHSEKKILMNTFLNLYNTDLTFRLKNLNTPTLIVWGMEDKVIKPSKADIFKQHINNSKLLIYPQLGHATIHNPQAFKDVLLFLNEN